MRGHGDGPSAKRGQVKTTERTQVNAGQVEPLTYASAEPSTTRTNFVVGRLVKRDRSSNYGNNSEALIQTAPMETP
jgi:hypothetical protein